MYDNVAAKNLTPEMQKLMLAQKKNVDRAVIES